MRPLAQPAKEDDGFDEQGDFCKRDDRRADLLEECDPQNTNPDEYTEPQDYCVKWKERFLACIEGARCNLLNGLTCQREQIRAC